MAATLVEGQKYGLDSNESTRGKRSIIYVKLTDSALRSFEDFSKAKVGCSLKPTIQFTNKSGVISIPGQGSSDDSKPDRRFHFSVSKILGDANGSFDCVQQTRTRQGAGLGCLGSMQYKATVHANSDVYSDTRKKFAIADTESKKSCAKEIKMSGRFSGKKIKKVIPSSQYHAAKLAAASSSTSTSSSSSHRSHQSSSSSLASCSLSSLSSSLSSAFCRLPSTHMLSSSSNTSVSSSDSGSGRLSAASSSTTISSSSSSAFSGSGRGASLVNSVNGILRIGKPSGGEKMIELAQSLPFRDRVIHHLAVKPYKRPEIKVKLMREGIQEKDRETLEPCLREVAVLNKNKYLRLADDAWKYVQPDWPLYSPEEKEIVLRNRQEVKSRTSTSPPAAAKGSSPVTTTSSPNPPQKRTFEDPEEQMFISKKRHRSHQPTSRSQTSSSSSSSKQPLTAANTTKSHHSLNTTTTTRHGSSHSNSNNNSRSSLGNNNTNSSSSGVTLPQAPLPMDVDVAHGGSNSGSSSNSGGSAPAPHLPYSNCEAELGLAESVSSGCDSGVDSLSTVTSSRSSDKDDSPLPESPDSNCENQGKADDPPLQDFMLQYSKIRTCEQWQSYKDDFNRDYTEYRRLHNKLMGVSSRFQHLKERINNLQEGSHPYQELYRQVVAEYRQRKMDTEFQWRKQRVDYLHQKLSHIKQCIVNYDRFLHIHQCS